MQKRIIIVPPPEEGSSLIDFLSRTLNVSKKNAKKIIDARRVYVNNHPIWMAKHRLVLHDKIIVFNESFHATHNFPILYESNEFLIINKPYGILSNGKCSVEEIIQNNRHTKEIKAAHRLDRDTSGCLILAKNPMAKEIIIQTFKTSKVRKIYLALVYGSLNAKELRIKTPLDDLPAETIITTQQANKKASFLLISITTGRTHQIRRHLASIGHPIMGDYTYGTGHPLVKEIPPVPRQMLHAYKITFSLPSLEQITAMAPIPRDFYEYAALLGLRIYPNKINHL